MQKFLGKPVRYAGYEVVKRASGEKESFEIAVPLQNKHLYYSSAINSVKDDTGEVILTVIHGKDITDRKRDEDKIKKLLAKRELTLREATIESRIT